jgi:hypothetical protein
LNGIRINLILKFFAILLKLHQFKFKSEVLSAYDLCDDPLKRYIQK